jgi:hypothetical protein
MLASLRSTGFNRFAAAAAGAAATRNNKAIATTAANYNCWYHHHNHHRRPFSVVKKGPHSDPLHLFQQECIARQLCDGNGNRLPGVDWRIILGVADASRPGAVRVELFVLTFDTYT